MYYGYNINWLSYPFGKCFREKAARVFVGMVIYFGFTEVFILHASRS